MKCRGGKKKRGWDFPAPKWAMGPRQARLSSRAVGILRGAGKTQKKKKKEESEAPPLEI